MDGSVEALETRWPHLPLHLIRLPGNVGFAAANNLAAIAAQVRQRVLRWFARSGLLEAADAQDMLTWEHGGFSLDAAVRIAGDDRAGLERLLRYDARPAFALERLTQVTPERVV